jgi:hypothetical protein
MESTHREGAEIWKMEKGKGKRGREMWVESRVKDGETASGFMVRYDEEGEDRRWKGPSVG